MHLIIQTGAFKSADSAHIPHIYTHKHSHQPSSNLNTPLIKISWVHTMFSFCLKNVDPRWRMLNHIYSSSLLKKTRTKHDRSSIIYNCRTQTACMKQSRWVWQLASLVHAEVISFVQQICRVTPCTSWIWNVHKGSVLKKKEKKTTQQKRCGAEKSNNSIGNIFRFYGLIFLYLFVLCWTALISVS